MEDTLKRRWLALPLILALTPAPPVDAQTPPAKEAVLWARLRARIDAVDHSLDGVLGVAVKDLKTGNTIALRADETFPTASSIKLAVLYELFRQAEEGRVDLGEITRPTMPRVGGGGVLERLGDRVSLSWRDVAVLMIGWSDNEATNLLIDRLGLPAVNQRLDSLGLPKTRLRRRMMDLEAARQGRENVSTPAEMARLVEVVARGTGLPAERAKDLRAVAATPEKHTAFRAPLPENVVAYTKSGELDGVRCEIGLVDLAGRPYAAALMTTYLRRDTDGEAAIREISAALYETFDRLARSSEHGRIIDER
jgi:beta-lactamase class A